MAVRLPRSSLSAPDVHSYIPKTGDTKADSVTAVLALLRQWSAEAQTDAHVAIETLLDAGFGFDDVDPSSGLSLLHYAVRSGATGIGNDEQAARLVTSMLKQGANAAKRCRFAYMLPIHYAATFGCAKVIDVLADFPCDMDGLAPRFDGGCALHLAVQSQSVEAVRSLVNGGANPFVKNDTGNTPLDEAEYIMRESESPSGTADVLYDPKLQREIIEILQVAQRTPDSEFEPPLGMLAELEGIWIDQNGRFFGGNKFELRSDGTIGIYSGEPGLWIDGTIENLHGNQVIIAENKSGQGGVFRYYAPPNAKLVQEEVEPGQPISILVPTTFDANDNEGASPLQNIQEEEGYDDPDDINVGDRVLVNNKKVGTVRYKGETHFKPEVTLYGIQLVNPEGKHNGTIGTKTYFRCRKNHGTFAPRRKLKLLPAEGYADVEMKRTPAPDNYVRPAKHVSPAPFSFSTIVRGNNHSLHGGVATAPEQYERRKAKNSPRSSRKSKSPPKSNSASPGTSFMSPLGMPTPFSPSVAHAAPNAPKILSPQASDTAGGFGVGSIVTARGKEGTVVFVGEVEFSRGIHIGIDFSGTNSVSLGEHNGTVEGKSYFELEDRTGILIPATEAYWKGLKVLDVV